MRRTISHAALATLCALRAWAQTPAFDVVSIKPNLSGSNSDSSKSHDGVFTGTNLSLKWLITFSYKLRDYQVAGPDWLDKARFDIAAKPPAGKDLGPQLNLMIQSMLAERFKLAAHRENKEFPVYGLMVAKGGPKFQPVEDTGHHNNQGSRGKFTGQECTMARLAEQLGRQMDRPVLDMTGLKGVFNLTLNWTPEEAMAAKEETKVDIETYPPLLTALQQQLGLKLEPKKAPVEVLVVDRIEKLPTEN